MQSTPEIVSPSNNKMKYEDEDITQSYYITHHKLDNLVETV